MAKQNQVTDHQDNALMLSWSGEVSWKMCPLYEDKSEGRVIDSLDFQFESCIS